jgi:hypothetical protein
MWWRKGAEFSSAQKLATGNLHQIPAMVLVAAKRGGLGWNEDR